MILHEISLKGYLMKNFLLIAILLFSYSSASAYISCFDDSLSAVINFTNCMIEAKKGDARSQYNIGVMYEDGQGITQDYKEAVKWYRKSAEQGFDKSQNNLGTKYAEGKGVIQEIDRVSKPGRRVYKGKQNLPWVLSGLGIAIVSTPKGVMTDREARRSGIGGEILCYVW